MKKHPPMIKERPPIIPITPATRRALAIAEVEIHHEPSRDAVRAHLYTLQSQVNELTEELDQLRRAYNRLEGRLDVDLSEL